MKLSCYFIALALFVLTGCAAKNSGGENSELCKKPKFSKIIINISADNIEIPEDKYVYLKEPLLNITRETMVDTIKDELKDDASKIIIEKNQKCSSGAILVDGQLTSLKHRSKRFSSDMLVKMINCSKNKTIFSDEFSAQNKDHDFPDTPTELGGNAGEAIVERLNRCEDGD